MEERLGLCSFRRLSRRLKVLVFNEIESTRLQARPGRKEAGLLRIRQMHAIICDLIEWAMFNSEGLRRRQVRLVNLECLASVMLERQEIMDI